MKKSLISFHYTYILVAFSFIITGYFSNLIIFTSLIIVHEMGHYLICIYKKITVNKIVIYPYGGVTEIEDYINRNIDDELMVAVFGIIFQSLYFFIVLFLYQKGIIRLYIYNIYLKYHLSMLIFNILPIYPLDGYKILNLLLSKKISYKLCNKISLIISIIMIIILLCINYYRYNYAYIMILSILSINIYMYYKKIAYLFYRFLLERYLYNISYKDIAIINSYKKMYKNKNHIIKYNNKYIKEQKFLQKLFDKD